MKSSQTTIGCFFIILSLVFLSSCASTQKTAGSGLVSVVAQNVVRIAGVKSMKDANLSLLKDKETYIKLTGFVDDKNRGFIDHIVRSAAENAGAKLVGSEDKGKLILEVAVNSTGNDFGNSKVPILTSSERTEGIVDADLTIRDASNGTKLATQHIRGEAKYEQTTVVGIQGSGTYYVKNMKGDFIEVNPENYR